MCLKITCAVGVEEDEERALKVACPFRLSVLFCASWRFCYGRKWFLWNDASLELICSLQSFRRVYKGLVRQDESSLSIAYDREKL